MNARLARLALRRVLTPGLLVFAAVAVLVAVTAHWSPTAGVLRDVLGTEDPTGVERALTRQGVWTALALALLPLIVYRAAAVAAAWRRGEVDWLGSSPASRTGVLLSTWLGATGAGALLVAGVALAAEIAAGGGDGATASRLVGRTEAPRAVLVEDDAPARWTVEARALAGASGGTARVHVFPVAGGPSAEVRLTAERAGAQNATTRHVSTRTALTVPLPPGTGPVTFALERVGPGTVLAIDPRGVDLIAPAASERAAGLELWTRALLSLATWLALALGLGTWVRPATACAAVVALALFAWSYGIPNLPWSDLPRALALVGERLVPPPVAAPVFAATAALVVLGLGVGGAGMRSWRRAQ